MLLDRFPHVRVILDHCARPQYEDGPPYAAAASLWNLKKRENVFLKITPHNFLGACKGLATPETFFKKVIAEFGPQRIAWGSNFPAHEGSLTALLAMARESVAFASAEEKDWIFGRTAKNSLSGARQIGDSDG
jgi:predicted TIM-barrel fold metal-dependent hydrolase